MHEILKIIQSNFLFNPTFQNLKSFMLFICQYFVNSVVYLISHFNDTFLTSSSFCKMHEIDFSISDLHNILYIGHIKFLLSSIFQSNPAFLYNIDQPSNFLKYYLKIIFAMCSGIELPLIIELHCEAGGEAL